MMKAAKVMSYTMWVGPVKKEEKRKLRRRKRGRRGVERSCCVLFNARFRLIVKKG